MFRPDRPRLHALSAVLLASSVAAQTPHVDWPMHRGDRALTGVATGALRVDPELAWTFETADAILSSPAIVAGVVYFGSGDQSVYALDLESGAKRWSFPTDDIVEAPPLVLDGRVYIGSSDFFFYAIDARTGELVWKVETGDKILGGASYLRMPDGTTRILVGSYDTFLYCFDAATGEKVWAYQTDNYVNGTPAMFDDKVVFGGCDARLHVVSAQTGEAVDRIDLGSDCHVAGSVAVVGGRAYFGHYGNVFVCVDVATGETVWSYGDGRQPFFASPSITANRVVFGGRDKKMHCVDRVTGEPLWSFPTRRKIDGSAVVCGDKVVFGSGDGRLYMLSLETGDLLWSYEIGKAIFSSPAIYDSHIVIGANDGAVYAFRARPKDGSAP